MKVTNPIKGLNKPSGEPDIDEDGNKAQNIKEDGRNWLEPSQKAMAQIWK